MLHGLLAQLLAADPEVRVVEGERADVLVISQADPEDDDVPLSLLFHSPRSRVLTLGAGARRAVLHELRPHRTALGELSREALLEALHGHGEAR